MVNHCRTVLLRGVVMNIAREKVKAIQYENEIRLLTHRLLYCA